MKKDDLVSFLYNLPEETLREFELNLTRFALNFNSPENKNLITQLNEILEESYPEKVKYYAFYCLNLIYRYKRDYYKLNDLFEKYGSQFGFHITYDHLYVLFQIESESMYDFNEVLRSTFKDSQLFPDNAGLIHLFPVVFSTIYESDGLTDVDSFNEIWYEKALEAVNKAIELDPKYARYYCTKGRVLAVKEEFDQAIQFINKAISLENSSRDDYALRLNEYQYYKLLIQFNKKISQMKKEMPVRNENENDNTVLQKLIEKENVKPEETDNSYIFVSYSHKDANEVIPIIRKIQEAGLKVWFDEGILPGSEYTEVIGEKLINSSGVVFMLSPNSINREFVRMELQLATKHQKKRLGVFLEDTILSPGMELQLTLFQLIQKNELEEYKFYEDLIKALKEF